MSAGLAAFGGSQALWFVSRGSGLVVLVAFSLVMVLGVATRLGSAPARWPRFAIAELHRTLALFSVAFLALHIVTAILDPYVSIGWAATVLPFASAYRPPAIALGTLAIDLGGAGPTHPAAAAIMTSGTRLRVDSIACDGRGLCAELLPELITLDDWGFPIIRAGDVPAGLVGETVETVRICPKLALRLDRRS